MKAAEKVALELAVEEDAAKLAEISKRALHSDVHVGAPTSGKAGANGGEGGPPGYDSPAFQARMMQVCRYFRIVYAGRVVGGLIASQRRPGHYELERIFVDPDYQNRGVATSAFEQAFAMYPDAKIWTLGTPEWNVRTKHFYEKLGFVQIGWTYDYPSWRGRYYEKQMAQGQWYERPSINDLASGMRGVEVEAKVLEVAEPRQVRSRTTGEPLRVAAAIVSDETGTMTLTLWNDQIRQVHVNDHIRINNGYVTSFQGQKQLNVGPYYPLIVLL